ncbi:MAG TPA: Na+/H+ antiporter subunit E [Chitinophagales bacterium]|nr:Na+/H+ antiporter subunit E [Chitinophagales bacterium]
MVKHFLLNILLSFVWVALSGHLNYSNFIFGYLLGFFILWMIERLGSNTEYFMRVPKIILFFIRFLYDMLKANLEVAFDLITPKLYTEPGIIAYPLSATTDFEITMLSNIIALTPGTMVLDLSDDRKVIYIHVMYLKNKEKFIEDLKKNTEKKLLEILR